MLRKKCTYHFAVNRETVLNCLIILTLYYINKICQNVAYFCAFRVGAKCYCTGLHCEVHTGTCIRLTLMGLKSYLAVALIPVHVFCVQNQQYRHQAGVTPRQSTRCCMLSVQRTL